VKALEKFVGFLGRHFGPPRLFLAVAAWVLALGAWGMVARTYLPVEHRLRWEIPLELRAPLYAKFDSGWYLAIIEWGYGKPPPDSKPSNHAFFPLYPTTAKVLHDTFAMDGFHAGLVVTYVCLFLAMSLFYREGVERLGERDAAAAVAFFLLFPTAFFLAAVYAESMFLLFALLAFHDARRGSAVKSALWGFLLGLTRASALAVAPALFLATLEKRSRDGRRPWGRALVTGLVPAATVFLWIFGIGWVYGEPGLFFRSMQGWHRGASSLSGIAAWVLSMKVRFVDADWKRDPTLVLDYGAALVFAAVSFYQLAKKRWADAAWTGAAITLPMTTGLSGGMPRFLMVVYPVYFALAEGSRGRPRVRLVWWIVSGGLLLAAAARFVNWHWVA
jgi:Mannosyltransferase (PIG-V)